MSWSAAPPLIVFILVALAVFSIPPTTADFVEPRCRLDEMDTNGPEHGDGPAIGDAPDDEHILTPYGCYNGALAGDADIDAFRALSQGRVSIGVKVLSGCLEAAWTTTISPIGDGHTTTTQTLCAGERYTVGYPSELSHAWVTLNGTAAEYLMAFTPSGQSVTPPCPSEVDELDPETICVRHVVPPPA